MARATYIEPSLDEWLNRFHFTTEIKVRLSETDMSGHVNNTSYFVYFEQARTEYLNSLGFYQGDVRAVTADLLCHFHGEAFFPSTLVVGVRAAKLGNKSIDLEYYIKSSVDQKLVATGRGALVIMDKKTKQSTLIPEYIRKEIGMREKFDLV
ncbi:thioesterase family protein [Neobacillus sp.]|uniref:acyl-CoA thioesterase n=1 Tax=Neobacillus sp. TaxID=2675273 RepID=UPI0028A0AB8B|nr:thioesterase family protein [Neobacillus sp.]